MTYLLALSITLYAVTVVLWTRSISRLLDSQAKERAILLTRIQHPEIIQTDHPRTLPRHIPFDDDQAYQEAVTNGHT